jgi:hypothetical protein
MDNPERRLDNHLLGEFLPLVQQHLPGDVVGVWQS